MANPVSSSTSATGVKWINQIGADLQKHPHTRPIFDSQDIAHLLLWETLYSQEVDDECYYGNQQRYISPNAGESNQGTPTPTVPLLTHRKIPRAKSLRISKSDRYILLRKYEGFIRTFDKYSFTAQFIENLSDYPVMEAEFAIDEISEDDRRLLAEGIGVVWTIGYRLEGSMRTRESQIYIRRRPEWTKQEADDAKRQLDEITRGISWD